MWRLWLSAVVALVVGFPGGVLAAQPVVIAPGDECRVAVAAAEARNALPAYLLAAISRVESGRSDPETASVAPWPWTVNAEGKGTFYDTKALAIAAVRDLLARGVRSIDVGCGQINLMYHPNAFPSLEAAFDPDTNAAYAAEFLKALFARSGDWNKAMAMYHSATPDLGAAYQRKVLAAWTGDERHAAPVGASALAKAWGATLSAPPPGFTRVWRPRPEFARGSLLAYQARPRTGG